MLDGIRNFYLTIMVTKTNESRTMKKLSHAALLGIILAYLSAAGAVFAADNAVEGISSECGNFDEAVAADAKTVSESDAEAQENLEAYSAEDIGVVKESFGAADGYNAADDGVVFRDGIEWNASDALKLRAQKAIPDPLTIAVIFAAMALSLSLYKKGR